MTKNKYNKIFNKWAKILAPNKEEKKEFREWESLQKKKVKKVKND